MGYRLDGEGFDSRQKRDIFLFSTASRQVLGPFKASCSWGTGATLLIVERSEVNIIAHLCPVPPTGYQIATEVTVTQIGIQATAW
jgi:hypothetical protein